MKTMKKYIPLLLEGILFTICFGLLILITNESNSYSKIDKTTTVSTLKSGEPRYITLNPKKNYNPIENTAAVLKTYVGNVSFYGPDCGGCKSGYTASGYKVDKNNIYYSDKEYGTVLVVAADSSIPFGTILRMNILGDTKYGIVLDRGDIGFNQKYLFDVLVESEALSYKYGVNYSTKIEVLRFGY